MKIGFISIFVLVFLFFQSSTGQSRTMVGYYHRSFISGAYELGNVHYIINDNESLRKNKQWSIDIVTVNGIRIKRHELGIGIGADVWKDRWFIPLFLDYSFAFTEKKVSPYGSVDVGYAFGKIKGDYFTGDEKGSVLVRPSFGLQVRLTKKLYFVSQVFYKMQSVRTDYTNGTVSPDGEIIRTKYFVYYHFMGLNVGIKL